MSLSFFEIREKFIRTFGFCLIFITLLPITKCNIVEGMPCSSNGLIGTCTVVSKCNDINKHIRQGEIQKDAITQCGLGPLEEIICCPNQFTHRNLPERAAVRACQNIEFNKTASLTPLIVGGTPVLREEYPHMAAVAFLNVGGGNQRFTYRCGGSLIAKRYVLSVAHCFFFATDQPVFVRLGMLSTDEPLNSDGQEIDIAYTHLHPNYTISSKYNDVAIIELKKDAIFTTTVYPTCLYTDMEDPPSNFQYYVSGWGTINVKTREQSNVLLKARLDIVPFTSCNESYAKVGMNPNLASGILQTQLCAHDPGYTKDACQGDSGGPLLQITDATLRSYRIVGIISTGIGCVTRTPGIYTRVAAYLNFIEDIVWKDL